MFNVNFRSVALAAAMAVAAGDAVADGPMVATEPKVQAPAPAAERDGRFATLFGAPNAVAPRPGFASVAFTWANPRGGISGRDADGDMSLSYTLGNAVTGLAVTTGVTATGLDPFGDAGSFSLEAARVVSYSARSATFVGVSAAGLGAWGAGKRDPYYAGYVTQTGVLGKSSTPYIWTLGYGTDNTYESNGSGQLKDGFVWGGGIGLVPNVSLSVSGTETQVNTGLIFAAKDLPGWSVKLGVYDVTDNVDRRQTSITVGYGFDTKGLFK